MQVRRCAKSHDLPTNTGQCATNRPSIVKKDPLGSLNNVTDHFQRLLDLTHDKKKYIYELIKHKFKNQY